jgi:transcription elongation factor Elf1
MADYPTCPSCGRAMTFTGTLVPEDDMDAVFYCSQCKATYTTSETESDTDSQKR